MFRIKAGTKGWFMTSFNGADVAEFAQDTPVVLSEYSTDWMITEENVPGFPTGHPPIMIYKGHLSEAEQATVR